MISFDEYQKRAIANLEQFLNNQISADEFHDTYFELRRIKIEPNSKSTLRHEKLWVIGSIFGLVESYCPSEFEPSQDDFTAEQLKRGVEVAWNCKNDDEVLEAFVKEGFLHLPENK